MNHRPGKRPFLLDLSVLEERALLTTLIAIIDSGVDLTDASVVPYLDLSTAYDAYNKETYAQAGPKAILDTSLQHGHGSVVANMTVQGVLAAATAAGSQPVDVKIMPIRDTSSALNIDTNAMIRGVFWAADHGASVINLSVNTYYNPSLYDLADPNHGATLVQAIQYAESKGAVVVTGPGNSGRSIDQIPVFPPFADDARYSLSRPTPTNVLVAAATNAQGDLTPVSNWGPIHVDLGAYSGPEGFTSYSSAYAAGVAGVVADLTPAGTTPRQLLDILEETATPRAQSVGAWSKTGGVLNPAAAVARVTQAVRPITGKIAIDAGGRGAGDFSADGRFDGGMIYSTTSAIDVGGVSGPAPQAVYQTERYGNFSYTVDSLSAGGAYQVRLDFAEIFHDGPNKRLFDVSINDVPVLNAFDVYSAAGGKNKAIARDFATRADATGTIRITFKSLLDNAKVDGIEISPASDLAFGKPAFASSSESPQYSAAKAVDGDLGTRWSSGQWTQNTQTGWFAVDLQDLYQITDVRLQWESAYAVDYQIQVSQDAVSWTTIRTVTGNQTAGPVNLSNLSGTGRYVRVYSTQTSAGSNNYSLYDLQVHGARSTDLAAGKPATASSSESATTSPSDAVDQDSSSRWSSGQWRQNKQTGWISVDLGGLYTISSVRLNWENAYASSYEIQSSADGTTWTTLRAVTGDGAKGIVLFPNLNGVGRYIRIYCTKPGGSLNNYSLYDFNVYGAPLSELAAGQTAYASSVEGGGFAASLAVDGNAGTRWSSGQWLQKTETGWLTVDLGARFDLYAVRLNWETAYAVDFQIQVSNDGANWTSIRSVTGANAPGVQNLTGLSGSGRFVRIYCTRTSDGSNNYSLFDLQIFGVPSAVSARQTVAAAPPASIADASSATTAIAPLSTTTPSSVSRAPMRTLPFASTAGRGQPLQTFSTQSATRFGRPGFVSKTD